MHLEAVGRVSMRDLCFEVRWQIDDVDGSERAFLGAYSTTYAQPFGNEGDLGLWRHLDTKFASP